MKREILLLITILFLIPFALAQDNSTTNSTSTNSTNTTVINSPSSDNYGIELSIDKAKVQLGDNIIINGKVYKNNNLAQDQLNMIFYLASDKDKNQIYLTIFDGSFYVSPRLRDLPSGNYNLDIDLIDLKGNVLKHFSSLGSFEIDNQLNVNVKLVKDQLLPGDKLDISGAITRNLDKKPVPTGDIVVEIDGVQYSTDIVNGNVNFEFIMATNTFSGYHDIKVRAQDGYGNFGENTLRIYVVPQQKYLDIILDKQEYLPGEELQIFGKVYDQANEEISEDVTLRIYNPKEKKVFEESFLSGASINYPLTEDVMPGEWRLELKTLKLGVDKFVNIPFVEKLSVNVEGQTLNIKNSGNVRYTQPLDISAISLEKDKRINLRTSLSPGDSFNVDLYKYLEDGDYDIIVNNTNETFSLSVLDPRSTGEKTGDYFSSFTGQAIRQSGTKNSNSATYTAIALVIVIVLGLVYLTRGRTITLIKRNKYKKQQQKEFAEPKVRIPSEKTQREKDIEDFRTRILKDIEEHNVKVKADQQKQEQKPERYNFDRPLSRDR